VKFHIHMLLTCRIYLNHDRDCDHFACQFLVRSFFGGGGGGRFNFLYTIGGVGKGFLFFGIVLHRVGGGSKKKIFAL